MTTDNTDLKQGRRRRWTKKVTAAAAATVLVGGGSATWASVSAADTPQAHSSADAPAQIVQVSGELVPKDKNGTKYRLSGELIGTWLFPAKEAETFYQSDTRFYQKGTEYFQGCVNTDGDEKCNPSEPSGRLWGEYLYWASYDSTGRLVEGGCTHMLNGGTKAFKGVRGLLRMTDVFSARTPARTTAIYQGEVILNAVDEAEVTAWPSQASLASATATTVKASC